MSGEKKLEWWGKIKQEENSPSPPSPHNSWVGMVVASHCFLGRLREGRQCRQQNSNLIEKSAMRKLWEWGEEKSMFTLARMLCGIPM
jgi:hypothetical protein